MLYVWNIQCFLLVSCMTHIKDISFIFSDRHSWERQIHTGIAFLIGRVEDKDHAVSL